MTRAPARAHAIVAALVLLAGCTGSKTAGSNAARMTSPPTTAVSGATAVPSSRSSSAGVIAEAARIGNSPEKLLARVSDGVTYEVYPGIFRGSGATLADGAGNDEDKALLLRDLIRAAIPAATLRFAWCTLAPRQQDQLIAAARRGYRVPKLLAQDASSLSAKTANANAQKFLQHVALVWTGVVSQANDQRDALDKELQSANAPSVPPTVGDLHPVVANHVWIQEQTAGSWTDLDPTLPHAKPGAALCAAQGTANDLPDADYDTIAAAVSVEQRDGASLETHDVVQGIWRTAQLGDASLTFAFAEPAGLDVPIKPQEKPGLIGFTPVLRAGTAITAGTPIYLPKLAPKSGGIGSAVGGVGSQAADLLSAATAAPPTPSSAGPAPSSNIVGAWLTLTVNAPGLKPETVQSTIFDRVSFADRVAGRAGSAPLAALDDGDAEYLPLATLWNVGVSEGTGVVGVGDAAFDAAKSDDAAKFIGELGSVQRTFYAARRALFATVTGGGAQPVISVQPGISLLAATLQPKSGSSPSIAPALLMDDASDHARPDGGDVNAARAWGVSSLVAERLTTSGANMMAAAAHGGDIGQVQASDVLAVFDGARKANVAMTLVRADSDIGAGLSADAKARLSASLAGGSIAFAPVSVVSLGGTNDFGWWLLGSDGSLRDEMQSGLHQDMPEEGALEEAVPIKAAPSIKRMGMAVNCAFLLMTALGVISFSGETGPEAAEAGAQSAEQQMAIFEEKELIEKLEKETEEAIKCD